MISGQERKIEAPGPDGTTGTNTETARVRREKKTVRCMVEIFCRKQHASPEGLCSECADLLSYALWRLDRCPYGTEKPTCAHCPIHCYQPEMRERIRDVMRFAGPKMIFSHGILALRHVLDGMRRCEKPARPER